MQQAAFGKNPSGKRLEKITKSSHYQNDIFTNLSPTAMMSEDASYFKILMRQFQKDETRTPSKPLPIIEHPSYLMGQDDRPVITWYGHSTYLIQVNGKSILADPVFSERTSFAQYIGPKAYPGTMAYDIEDLPPIDVVIISHDHYDHLDYNSILKLKATVKHYYVPLGVGSHLEHWSIKPEMITELDWWQNAPMLADMQLTATPARHFSGRGFVRNKTLWASYVLNTGKHNIYIGGDSGYDTHFREIGDKYGPFDIVILENGQYDANWPYIHMMPEQTVQASIDLQGKVLFPVHWGKYTLAAHPWNDPAIRVTRKAEELKVQVTTPRIGEQIIIDSIYPSDKWWYF
jgi:L-ascorbate metabolism protein UlaG (beta-lactamase superfamily)